MPVVDESSSNGAASSTTSSRASRALASSGSHAFRPAAPESPNAASTLPSAVSSPIKRLEDLGTPGFGRVGAEEGVRARGSSLLQLADDAGADELAEAEAAEVDGAELLDMDWKATLKAYLLPIDHPLVHQLSYPRRMQLRVGDGLWVRLVEVGAALGARAYADAEPVVLEVEDAFLPDNTGRWRIAAETAERTDDEPDLALGVGELGSVYLGGFGFGELVRAGVVHELREGGAARADALFRVDGPKPWCPEIF